MGKGKKEIVQYSEAEFRIFFNSYSCKFTVALES